MEPDLKHLAEMLVGFKGIPVPSHDLQHQLQDFVHLKDVVESAGLANLTALMASVSILYFPMCIHIRLCLMT